jgi:hypothetical protein
VLGGLALDLHAADRIDRNLGFRVGRDLMLAAATGSGGRGVIVSRVMIVAMVTAGVMAGDGVWRAGSVFATVVAVGHFSIPPLLNKIPLKTIP